MWTRSTPRQWLLTLLCATLLVARMDGAHLHLCLDGQESPSSVHVWPDAPAHADTQAPHNDVDLALAADSLAKPGKGDVDQPVALPPRSLAMVVAATQFGPLIVPSVVFPPASSVLLPPLRGPPASLTA